jgi:NADH-quinone oxidoreductase subunit G
MATIIVDNRAYTIPDGQNLLHACLSLGLNLPYFCWHPALGSVGACRQCAVKVFKDEKDTRGQIVMACMTPAANGARLAIEDPEAREFRRSVTEWMMMNHPHDCPVCDEGGECHLQDMTVMTGHTYREYRDLKRTFRNQDLGPFVNHEMNRCIQCYRCVRFYRDYAGGRDFDAFGLRNVVYFGRHADGTLENEFSGNLVEVCPTGVFTDKSLKRHYTRKWDLQTAPSVCVHCGLGCNTIPGERSGKLRRIRNRYNGEVNGYFLCDRGRYGYEFVNSEKRIRRPLLREEGGGSLEAAEKTATLQRLASLVKDGSRLIGIGSPRASLEANFALRALVGPERFFLGIAEAESDLLGRIVDILRRGPARSPSLAEVEAADAVFVLGEDVTNVAPRLALALRQSIRRQPMEMAERLHIPAWDDYSVREVAQEARGPLFLATVHPTKLEEVATHAVNLAPADLARLGFAVAHLLKREAPAVSGLPEELGALAASIAETLREAKRAVIVSGTSAGSKAIVQAAANVAWALHAEGHPADLCFLVPECNSLGLALLGGRSLRQALQAVEEGTAETVLVLENDLTRRAGPAAVQEFLGRAQHLIVLDHLKTATAAKAEAVLPVSTFAEGDGTLVSSEGRAQRFYQVLVPEGEIQESWRWLRDLMLTAGRSEVSAWHALDDVVAAMAEALPVLAPVLGVAPPASFRLTGQKIPRQPHRYSGRTALDADKSVHEPQPPEDPDSPLAFSMEGYPEQPPAALITHFWSPGWNSIQALNKFQEEVGGPLRGGDPGRRVIEPSTAGQPAFFHEVPEAFAPRADEWLAVPIPHIFGSEELSVLSPGVAELAPGPYVGLSPEDAAPLGVGEGGEVEVTSDGAGQHLAVRLVPGLPKGVAGIPAGLPGSLGLIAPAWVRLARREQKEAA